MNTDHELYSFNHINEFKHSILYSIIVNQMIRSCFIQRG